MISILDAILAINPNARVSVQNNSVDNITWEEGQTVISKEDIETKKTQLEAEYNENDYQRKRATEYPSIVDQLYDIYHNGVDGWKTTIKAVKDKYPKGTS